MYVRCKLLYLGLYFYWTMLDRDGKSSAYLSVRDEVSWSHMLEFLKKNFMDS